MAASDVIDSPFAGLGPILDKVIGSSTKTGGESNLTIDQLVKTLLQQTTNENTSNQSTTQGTSNAQTLQQLLSTLSGTVQGNTTNTSTTNADVSSLQKVFAQQQAGITPDMLAAIFREGSKAAPGLVAATANAVGARPGENSALATSLARMNSDLTSQAATLNNKMLSDSATTAGQIAALTKSTTDTGTTAQSTSQQKGENTTGSQSAQTSSVQDQLIQKLTSMLSDQSAQTNSNQKKTEDATSKTGINTGQTAAAAGLAGLASLIGSGKLGSMGNDLTSAIGKLLGGSSGANIDWGGLAGIGGAGTYTPVADGGSAIITDPIFGSDGGGVGGGLGGGFDWSGFGDGLADGGEVKLPQLTLEDSNSKKAIGPSAAQLLALTQGNGSVGGNNLATLIAGAAGSANLLIPATAGTESGGGNGPGTGGVGASSGSNSSPSGAANSSASVGNASSSVSNAIGPGSGVPSAVGQAALGIGLSSLMGPLLGMLVSRMVVNMIAPPPSKASPAPAAAASPNGSSGTGGDDGSGGIGGTAGVGTVGVGAATATDAEGNSVATGMGPASNSNSVGASDDGSQGDSGADAGAEGSADGSASAGDGSGDGAGGSGDGSGDGGGGGSGWQDGGLLPRQSNDPTGTKDGIMIKVSGGEYVMPTDVVQILGSSFFDSLRLMHHTPVGRQQQ